ncbi:MAG: hypothetical protein VCD31_13705 [Alphaproteobacteria bacterium]
MPSPVVLTMPFAEFAEFGIDQFLAVCLQRCQRNGLVIAQPTTSAATMAASLR